MKSCSCLGVVIGVFALCFEFTVIKASTVAVTVKLSNALNNSEARLFAEASCTDGIKNQFEELIDCGGPCPPCPDLCQTIICQNGGVCSSGRCICPPPWGGDRCSIKADNGNLCYRVSCLYGSCKEGFCVCDPGYTGTFCTVDDGSNSAQTCAGVFCGNGFCSNGQCICDTGWGGIACTLPGGDGTKMTLPLIGEIAPWKAYAIISVLGIFLLIGIYSTVRCVRKYKKAAQRNYESRIPAPRRASISKGSLYGGYSGFDPQTLKKDYHSVSIPAPR